MVDYGHIFENDGLSYENYRELISTLLIAGKTTGPDNSEAMLHYTKMNNQRMNRVEKTTELLPELLSIIENLKGNYHLLVISEGWCGDAAQILPVIQKIAVAARERFTLKMVWRDQQPELMNQHLTNGGKAIPTLLVLNEQNELVLPKWGPRPAVLQQLLAEWKKEEVDYAITAEKLHSWYAKDKTITTQLELKDYLGKLI
jgi:thioredoxin-like negative regulator of GroEL